MCTDKGSRAKPHRNGRKRAISSLRKTLRDWSGNLNELLRRSVPEPDISIKLLQFVGESWYVWLGVALFWFFGFSLYFNG